MVDIDNKKMWESMLKRANIIKDKTLYNILNWSLADQGLEYKDGEIVSAMPISVTEQTKAPTDASSDENVYDYIKLTDFEETVEEMASEVMGYTFASNRGVQNVASQLMKVARKQLES